MLKKLTPLKNRGYVSYFYIYIKLTPIKLWVCIFKDKKMIIQLIFSRANRI
ncbi:MAG: hypothetical protein ACI9AV_002402 [Sediminicola sp.]|jgi:hypothetical protein